MTLKVLDLFHGAGGCSIGAQTAGAEIIAGIDYWYMAHIIYKNNFPHALSINRDIRKVKPKNLHNKIGEINLILASPECTNHSCAKGNGIRDEESRKTALQVIRFASEFRPKWIIIENVMQMKFWPGYEKLLKDLQNLDYFILEQTLNAKDFGVPQSRKRLFIICSKTEITGNIIRNGKTPEPAWKIINRNGVYPYSPLYTEKRAQGTLERAERAMSVLGKNEEFLIVYYGTDGGGGWQSLDRPLRTVTTLDRFAYVKPSKNGHVMRMLQPEELKLAMGFPQGFILSNVTRRDKIKLMGNAVCPPVIQGILRSLVI